MPALPATCYPPARHGAIEDISPVPADLTTAVPPAATKRTKRRLAYFVLALFVLPILVSACMSTRENGVPWFEQRRDATGLAPDPATTPEAVIQVYAARAVAWRAAFAVHTWIAVKPAGAPRFTR